MGIHVGMKPDLLLWAVKERLVLAHRRSHVRTMLARVYRDDYFEAAMGRQR
jgi:Leu/Phe-tRNA-protein transferase